MFFYQNKKSMVKSYIAGILLISVGFLLVLWVINQSMGKAEEKTAESICRGSVALREKSYRDIQFGVKLKGIATPLLCKTLSKYLPEDKEASKEQVQKEIADLMVKCWNQFGEGLIQDVFKEGSNIYKKNCFVCYTASLRETSKFNGEINGEEFRKYLFDTPYKVSPKSDNCKIDGGFCIGSENKEECSKLINADQSYLLIKKNDPSCVKNGKKSCCYTDYTCWNKGGICSANNPNIEQYKEYNTWSCPSQMKCFVKNEDYYSYGDYIQRFGGAGNIIILTGIKPAETYAISFGSPNIKSCELCTKIGLGTGVAGFALVFYFIPGVGWAALTVSALGGVVGYVAGKGGSEYVVESIQKLFDRNINTIYLTTLDDIQKEELCSIV